MTKHYFTSGKRWGRIPGAEQGDPEAVPDEDLGSGRTRWGDKWIGSSKRKRFLYFFVFRNILNLEKIWNHFDSWHLMKDIKDEVMKYIRTEYNLLFCLQVMILTFWIGGRGFKPPLWSFINMDQYPDQLTSNNPHQSAVALWWIRLNCEQQLTRPKSKK